MTIHFTAIIIYQKNNLFDVRHSIKCWTLFCKHGNIFREAGHHVQEAKTCVKLRHYLSICQLKFQCDFHSCLQIATKWWNITKKL